jgi:RNA polymerase sigma-70 factor (ECF subfamily)
MADVETPDSSAQLVARWRTGDQQAATLLWQRYAQRLLALARRRLSRKLARRVDPEDVVQSAYRSFFAGARDERYVLQHSGDLWRLLVAITLHKLHHQVQRHTAGKRALALEYHFGEERDLLHFPVRTLANPPSPSEAVMLVDELEHVMRAFPPLQRQMIQLRLQGYRLGEIAAVTRRNERTVRRVLQRVEQHLKQRSREYSGP